MDLAFSYMGKCVYYDNLLKNEGKDKYIIRIVLTFDRKMNVDVFRISEIMDLELLDRIYLIDDDHPLVYTYDSDVYILGYLSDAKALFKIIEGSLL
jgi:hypothetical protein